MNGPSRRWRVGFAAVGLLLLAAGVTWRCGALAGFYRSLGDSFPTPVAVTLQHAWHSLGAAPAGTADHRQFVQRLMRQLPSAAVERIQVQAFDPDAPVFVTAGADERPGQAGFDDDQDGVLDNPSELGAVFSDDATLAPTDPGYAAAAAETAPLLARVISRGAYVPLRDDRPLPSGQALRVILHGTAGGQSFVWPVEPRFGEVEGNR